MPRSSKGPHLWKRPARRKDGKLIARAIWIIKDGGRQTATGCLADAGGPQPPEEAKRRLSEYIAEQYDPIRKLRDIEAIDCGDVLMIYLRDTGEEGNEHDDLSGRIKRLATFWNGKKLADVNPSSCRDYVDHRGNKGGSRRDLETFRAAINHHERHGLHRGADMSGCPLKANDVIAGWNAMRLLR
jgi:hypothetical protein